MTRSKEFVDGLKDEKAKELLVRLIDSLDEIDGDDELGTEGWRHRLGFESDIPEA